LELAKALGADGLATGHYVQKKIGKNGSELHRAIDLGKDQSYFLFATTKDQLDFLHFPLGSNTKEETRKEAERLGLEIAQKPDSQDICFVPNGNYSAVISKLRPTAFKEGNVVHFETKKVLGKHNGIINFTLGQRRGLGIAYPEPLFVVKIDPKENIVFVGSEIYLQNKKFKIVNNDFIITPQYKKIVENGGMKRDKNQGQFIITFNIIFPELSPAKIEKLKEIL
jgi:tRNA-specific 2-thiouridylase